MTRHLDPCQVRGPKQDCWSGVKARADCVVRIPRLTEGSSFDVIYLYPVATGHAVGMAQHASHRRVLIRSAAPAGTPQQVAEQMLAQFGWSAVQFSCLDALWERESGWNAQAENPSSGAYGIPQALPGDKMASAGADWQSDAATQIRWGLTYIQDRYGSPCVAWSHEEGTGWY